MNNEIISIILALIFFLLILILVFIIIGPKLGLNIKIIALNDIP